MGLILVLKRVPIYFDRFDSEFVKIITIASREYNGFVTGIDEKYLYLYRNNTKFISRFLKTEIAFIEKTKEFLESGEIFLNTKRELTKYIGNIITVNALGYRNLDYEAGEKNIRYEYCKLVDVWGNSIKLLSPDNRIIFCDIDAIESWEFVRDD